MHTDSISSNKVITAGAGPGTATCCPYCLLAHSLGCAFHLCQETVSQVMPEQRPAGGTHQSSFPAKSSEVPAGLRSKTVQLYGCNLCCVSWAENQSWLVFTTAVNVAIKLQRGMAVPEVCTASEEALNNLFACVPL